METKKISFGFMKTKKQEKAVNAEKREYIECLEEKAIKVVGGDVIQDATPLVIPMKPNSLITAERLKEIAEQVEGDLNKPDNNEKQSNPNGVQAYENETLDQMAVRELLEESRQEKKIEASAVKINIPPKQEIDGHKESTLEDYEAIPVQDFGLAMLRGMGWTPGMDKEQSKYKEPQLRPKGLGLGADKVIVESQKKNSAKDKDEELTIVKNAFVKITTGKYSGCFGKVVSLDEDNGRVMVNLPLKKETVSLSEFMMHPVTKSEFDQHSKVINADTYEEYKRKEKMQKASHQHISTKEREGPSSHRSNDDKDRKEKREKESLQLMLVKDKFSNGKSKDKPHRHRNYSNSSDENSSRYKRENKNEYSSSNESFSSPDIVKLEKKKDIKKNSSSDSDVSNRRSKKKKNRSKTAKEKRDIDKKRKGKKKKRDRDRSPSYRKHKK